MTTLAKVVAFVVTAITILGTSSGMAGEPVIDAVSISRTPEGSVVRIAFNMRLRYFTHVSGANGKILLIEMRPVLSPAGNPGLDVIERRSFVVTRENPLSEIRYEGNVPSAPKLALTFARPVTFQIRLASDLRSIDVIIENKAAIRPVLPATAKPARQAKPRPATTPAPKPAETMQRTEAAAPHAAAPILAGAYVLNLASRQSRFSVSELPEIQAFRRYRLYSYGFQKDGVTWYRLRLGFFETAEIARRVRNSLPQRYAKAWITKASPEERRASTANAMFREPPASLARRAAPVPTQGATPAPVPAPKEVAPKRPPDDATLPMVSGTRLEQIWQEARKTMVDRNYGRAVQLYTKLLQMTAHRYTQQAQEFLGLARERKGQLAHAKAEYEKYLELYPTGEGADRVRQRLAGILTARSEPKARLRTAARVPDPTAWQTQFYGSFAQFYSRRATVIDENGTQTTQSDLLSDLDFTARASDDRQDYRAVFVGGHGLNFLDEAELNESRVSTLYIDGMDRTLGFSGRVGRQTRNSGGILGRFDGALLGYQVIPGLKLNVAAGLPVDSTTRLSVENDRWFYGVNTDIGPVWEDWNFNLFAIEQTVDSLNDRRAVGGEARYLHGGTSFFSLVDYDVSYNVVNIALANASFRMEDETTFNIAADFRKSPILTTTNALQGQNVESIAQLRSQFSDSEIRGLAEDRTAFSQSVTLGLSRPLDSRFQASLDVTATRLSDTEASGGVEVSPGTGYEFFYAGQLTGTGLVSDNDVTIFGLRYADTDRSRTITGDLNVRYAFDEKWRVNPRLRADWRFNTENDGSRYRIRPSVRVNYRVRKWANLELEGGGEWSSETFAENLADPTTDSLTSAEWYLTIGYRVDF